MNCFVFGVLGRCYSKRVVNEDLAVATGPLHDAPN